MTEDRRFLWSSCIHRRPALVESFESNHVIRPSHQLRKTKTPIRCCRRGWYHSHRRKQWRSLDCRKLSQLFSLQIYFLVQAFCHTSVIGHGIIHLPFGAGLHTAYTIQTITIIKHVRVRMYLNRHQNYVSAKCLGFS